MLNDVFYGLPVMGEFLRQYVVRPLPTRHSVLHVLLDAYRQSGGSARPQIGILDWNEVPTRSEFELFTQYFGLQGVETKIVDPREVTYENGLLHHEGFTIDIIYKRVLITELIERGGLDQPVVRAVRDGNVCMVNPFRCKILYKKMSLAVLSDERNAHLFDTDETAIIRSANTLDPHGRRAQNGVRRPAHRPHPVYPQIQRPAGAEAQRRLRRHGIVLGWQTNASGWEQAVDRRCKRRTSCRSGWSSLKNRTEPC